MRREKRTLSKLGMAMDFRSFMGNETLMEYSPSTKEGGRETKSMGKDWQFSLTDPSTLASSRRICWKGKENSNGLMAMFTKGNGRTLRWKERVSLSMQMGGC